jgi:elongation factor 1 alpha-like protein
MEWSKPRFDEITAKLGTFLVQAGFRKSKLHFVPVSGLTGENLVKKTEGCTLYDWYKGQTLVERVGKSEFPESKYSWTKINVHLHCRPI